MQNLQLADCTEHINHNSWNILIYLIKIHIFNENIFIAFIFHKNTYVALECEMLQYM